MIGEIEFKQKLDKLFHLGYVYGTYNEKVSRYSSFDDPNSYELKRIKEADEEADALIKELIEEYDW